MSAQPPETKGCGVGRAGFTLIELLVALVVLGVFGMGAVNLFRAQHQAFIRQNEGVRITQNARAGLDMLARELRNAGFDPRGTAAAGLTVWSPDSVGWTADLNADGDVDDDEEDVLYFFQADPGAMIRREGGVEVEVADRLTDLTLGYFSDESGTVAATMAEIEQVGITMTYETPEEVVPGHLETQVALRNGIYE